MENMKKILLVEDNKINQDMLSRRLLRRGYEIILANNGSEDIIPAFELGANDYITKPIDFPVALARIQSQLNTIQAVRRDSIVEESPIPEQREKLPGNLVKPSEALNLDVEKQQSTLFTYQEETKLLRLPKAIKLLYAPIETRSWKTGSLVKLSETIAEIRLDKKIQLSLQSEINIRFWNQNSLKISGDISAIFLGLSQKDNDNLIVQFTSQFPVISGT